MADLSHLEYIFTRDSFTGVQRPDPYALLATHVDPPAAGVAAGLHEGLGGPQPEGDSFQPFGQPKPRGEAGCGGYANLGGAGHCRGGLLTGGETSRWRVSGLGEFNSPDVQVPAPGPLAPSPGKVAAFHPNYGREPEPQPPQQSPTVSSQSPTASPLTSQPPTHSASSPNPQARPGQPPNGKAEDDSITCQVCLKTVPSSSIRKYIRVRKVCNDCRTSPLVVKNGKEMRFCQLCSWFHHIECFDGKRHSCRAALEKHNQRRRQKTAMGKAEPSEALSSE